MANDNVTGHQEKKTGQLLLDGLVLLGIRVSEESIAQLISYSIELQKWNKRVNLVAKNTLLQDIVEKHFIDSLTLLPLLHKYNLASGPLLDVGSGAGFPGLVLKIACPSLETVLLEPRQRRVSFLNHIIRILSIKNIKVMMHRIENDCLLSEYDFSIITGRAVADIPTFLKMVSSRTGHRTLVVCMQGETGKQEWRMGVQDREFTWVGTEEYTLPFSGAKRYLLQYRKEN